MNFSTTITYLFLTLTFLLLKLQTKIRQIVFYFKNISTKVLIISIYRYKKCKKKKNSQEVFNLLGHIFLPSNLRILLDILAVNTSAFNDFEGALIVNFFVSCGEC